MIECPVYHSEDSKWYRHGEEPWRVRVVAVGSKLTPIFNVEAATYADAFEALYGRPIEFPVPGARFIKRDLQD